MFISSLQPAFSRRYPQAGAATPSSATEPQALPDQFVKHDNPAPVAHSPLFGGGWGKLLGFALTTASTQLDRSIQRDIERGRSRTTTYEQIYLYTEQDSRKRRYRNVYKKIAYDGNGKRKRNRDYQYAGSWHYYR